MPNSLFRKKTINLFETKTNQTELNRVLGVKDLVFMGIAAIVGGGIFSTIGAAAFDGGPGISLLFVFTGFTCGFCALCYAEFASRAPISGSAYTYAYLSFGEIIAWMIGWALILEYAISNVVIAISWSRYFNNLLQGVHIFLPTWLTNNYFSIAPIVHNLKPGVALTPYQTQALQIWNDSPQLAGWHVIINLPAFIIIVFVTALAYIGIKESKRVTNGLVIFKVCIIILIIIVGFFYVQPANWHPFLPNGVTGVMAGVSAVFFAYIGFDAISTTAEECKKS